MTTLKDKYRVVVQQLQYVQDLLTDKNRELNNLRNTRSNICFSLVTNEHDIEARDTRDELVDFLDDLIGLVDDEIVRLEGVIGALKRLKAIYTEDLQADGEDIPVFPVLPEGPELESILQNAFTYPNKWDRSWNDINIKEPITKYLSQETYNKYSNNKYIPKINKY